MKEHVSHEATEKKKVWDNYGDGVQWSKHAAAGRRGVIVSRRSTLSTDTTSAKTTVQHTRVSLIQGRILRSKVSIQVQLRVLRDHRRRLRLAIAIAIATVATAARDRCGVDVGACRRRARL